MREEKKMRDILQITGFIYTAIIAIVVDVIAILRFKLSNKDDEAKSLLAKEILMGSTFAIVVLVIVLLLSLLF